MPIDDLFESLGEFFEDGMKALLGKKSRKKLKRRSKKSGNCAAIASIGAEAHRKWCDKRKRKNGRDKRKGEKRSPEPAAENSSQHAKEIKVSGITVSVTECLRLNMLLAMISAAGADGTIDRRELRFLTQEIDGAPVSSSDKAMLTRMMNQPPPLEEIAQGATSPMEACELYGAALSVIEEDSPANTLFLRRFAAALKLDDDLVATIKETLDSM